MIDIHHHILPGLDDGPATMDEAVDMGRRAVEAGIRTVVATPHMLDGVFGVRVEQVRESLGKLVAALATRGVPLEVLPGSDVHLHEDLPLKIRRGEVVTVNDTGRYLLLEVPHTVLLSRIGGVLAELQASGIRPILTHPERHPRISGAAGPVPGRRGEPDGELAGWVSGGGLVQVTAGAYLGTHGRSAREAAERWARAGLVHLIATDAHPMPGREASSLPAAAARLEGIVGKDRADRIARGNPERIVRGEECPSS
jgi:protein-tyrosine phosphatase